jgi:hypothetical protein
MDRGLRRDHTRFRLPAKARAEGSPRRLRRDCRFEALIIGSPEQIKNHLHVDASVGPAFSLQMQANRLATAAYVALQKWLP